MADAGLTETQTGMSFEEHDASLFDQIVGRPGTRKSASTAGSRPTAEIRQVAELLKQVSDPTRLQVLMLLSEKERNVSELCADLGTQSQPAVSHHLALLRHGRLIEPRRSGKHNFYALTEAGRELAAGRRIRSSADSRSRAARDRPVRDCPPCRHSGLRSPMPRRTPPVAISGLGLSCQAFAEEEPGRGRRRGGGRPGRRPRAR